MKPQIYSIVFRIFKFKNIKNAFLRNLVEKAIAFFEFNNNALVFKYITILFTNCFSFIQIMNFVMFIIFVIFVIFVIFDIFQLPGRIGANKEMSVWQGVIDDSVILIFGEIPHTFVVKIDDFYFYFPQVEKGRQNALETNELSLKIGTREKYQIGSINVKKTPLKTSDFGPMRERTKNHDTQSLII